MSKKKLLSLALVVIMIAILSFSTLAWFTSQDEVTNKFTIHDSLNSFEVDVWEEVKTDGTTITEVGKGNREDSQPIPGATYEKILPEVEYLKTVHVENTSGNVLAGQYIMVEVTFTNYSALEKLGENNANYDCTGMLIGNKFSSEKTADVNWWYDTSATTYDTGANTATYKFYLKSVLEDGEESVLFDKFMLPETMDIDDVAKLASGFDIQIVAYAIQSANLKDPAGTTELDNAIYAFKQQTSTP